MHADRFTTRHDAQAAAALAAADSRSPVYPSGATPRAVLHYLKYFLFHVIGRFSAATILAGGPAITAGLLAVLSLYLVGDAVCGDDVSTPAFGHPGLLTAQLWLALPLLALIVFSAVWSVAPGDPLGFGAWVTWLTGYDVVAARDATH